MSIFDDTPLEIGTQYYDKKIIGWDAEAQKYLVSSPHFKKDIWLSREKVERDHGSSLLEGVEFREARPGSSYNTRYFRVRTDHND
jgi:hypothetical protein